MAVADEATAFLAGYEAARQITDSLGRWITNELRPAIAAAIDAGAPPREAVATAAVIVRAAADGLDEVLS